MSRGRRWSERRRRKKPSENRSSNNGEASTGETETPQVRTNDICAQTVIGSFDQKDLGGTVLWKEQADLPESNESRMKQIGHPGREEKTKKGREI